MKNTASGAKEKIIFIDNAHEKFFYEKLKEVRYHADTRRNVDNIYDFKAGCVKTECLREGWQTSGSLKVVRMAFNLYCNGKLNRVFLIMRNRRSR